MQALRALATSSASAALRSSLALPLPAVGTRFISKNTRQRIVWKPDQRILTNNPAPVVPVVVTDPSLVTSGVVGDVHTTCVKFSHPMPEYYNPEKPTQVLANNEMFAVVNVNGSQHKVAKDDTIMVDRLSNVDVGDKLAFDQVLLIGARDFTILGKPFVPTATVTAVVEQHTMTRNVNVFKMRRREGYHRYNRFRHLVTILRISDITLEPADASAATAAAANTQEQQPAQQQ